MPNENKPSSLTSDDKFLLSGEILEKIKSGNAERQARHRERLEQKGFVTAQVPREIVEFVKFNHAGDWLKLTQALGAGKEDRLNFNEPLAAGNIDCRLCKHLMATSNRCYFEANPASSCVDGHLFKRADSHPLWFNKRVQLPIPIVSNPQH